MKSKRILITLIIIWGFYLSNVNAVQKDSVLRMAHKVADWQLRHPHKTSTLDWVQGPFINGLMAISKLPGGGKYSRAVNEIGRKENWGVISTAWRANDFCTPQSWIEMFEIKHKAEMLEPIRKELDQNIEIVAGQDEELDFTEKNSLKWSWCDALYMAPPAFARMWKVTHDEKYREFLHTWWWKVSAYYYDTDEHLYFRDQNYFDRREPNGAKVFWSRGNGWVIGGLVRVLQYLPENDVERPKYEQQLREMCTRLKDIQDQDGLWHSGLLDTIFHRQAETSGSAFFIFGMAYAINEGIVDRSVFGPPVEKGWKALCTYVKPDGRFVGIQPIGDSPVIFDENNMMPFGVGAFLQAASEMYRLHNTTSGGKTVGQGN
jgi:unsaturated rhamnogalacturonyl hydrolase